MSKAPRQTQHRPGSEGVRSRELAQVKQENAYLKRQVARLHRLLEKKGIDSTEEPEAPPEPTLAAAEGLPEQPAPETQSSQNGTCPSCGSQAVKTFTTPTGKVISICSACKTRLT